MLVPLRKALLSAFIRLLRIGGSKVRHKQISKILDALNYLKRAWKLYVRGQRDPLASGMPVAINECQIPGSCEAHIPVAPDIQAVSPPMSVEPEFRELDSSPLTAPTPVILHQPREQLERVSVSSSTSSVLYPATTTSPSDGFELTEYPSTDLGTLPMSYPSRNGSSSFIPTAAIPNATQAVTASPDEEYKMTYCIHPGMIGRYEHRPKRSKDNLLEVIPPLTFSFEAKEDELPADWTPQVHPEGQLYFYKDMDYSRRYITQAYLRDNDTLTEIQRFCQLIENNLNNQTHKLPERFEIVLQLFPGWNEPEGAWGYYMVDHASRCIFWIHNFDVRWAVGSEREGVQDVSQMKYWIEKWYWKHWDFFPPDIPVPSDPVNDLRAALLHGNIDNMTSQDSTMPWPLEEARSILDLIEEVDVKRKDQSPMYNRCISAAIGRILYIQAHERFINFYGEHGARLSRDQSVFGNAKGQRTWLITVLSPLLYSAPHLHLRQLEKVWVDKVVSVNSWKLLVEDLKSEWGGVVLSATVLLNANVAFLAIPLLFPEANSAHTISGVSSPSQVFSLLSILASMGSIILGLVLSRKLQTNMTRSSMHAIAYLTRHESERLGMEPLSIMLSLPFAFLMWAVVTFLGAIAFLCLYEVQSLSQRIVTSVAWLILFVAFIWVIQRNWEPGGNTNRSFFYNIRRLHLSQFFKGEGEDEQLGDEEHDLESTAETRKGGILGFPKLMAHLGSLRLRRNPNMKQFTPA